MGHQVDIIASHRSDYPKLNPDVERFKLEADAQYMHLPETRGVQILKAIWLVLTNFHKSECVRSNYQKGKDYGFRRAGQKFIRGF